MAHTYKFDLDEWNDACDHAIAKFIRDEKRRGVQRRCKATEDIYAKLMEDRHD